MPATGLWEVAVELRKKQDSHSSLLSRLAPLREPLCIFASAHLGHGKSPVIPAQSPSPGILAALTTLAMCAVVVLVEKQDTAGDAPSTGAALQEFVAQLRALNVINALQLSQKQVNDLHSSLFASPVISVSAAHRIPSRPAHFAQRFRYQRHGAVDLRSSAQAAPAETIAGEVVVVGDSLYIFDSNGTVDEEALVYRSADPPLGHLRLIVPLCQTTDSGSRRPLFHCAVTGARPRSGADRQGLTIRLSPLWPQTQAVVVLCRALTVPSVTRDVPRETFVSMLSSASAPAEPNSLLAHTSVPASIHVVSTLDLRVSHENPDERAASLDLFDSLQEALLGPDRDRSPR